MEEKFLPSPATQCTLYYRDSFANVVKVAISPIQSLTREEKSADKIIANESGWQK